MIARRSPPAKSARRSRREVTNASVQFSRRTPACGAHAFDEQIVALASDSKSGGEQQWAPIGDVAFGHSNLNDLNGDRIIGPIGSGVGGPASVIISLDDAISRAMWVDHVPISHTCGTIDLYPSRAEAEGRRIAEANLAPGRELRLSQDRQ